MDHSNTKLFNNSTDNVHQNGAVKEADRDRNDNNNGGYLICINLKIKILNY